MAIHGLYTGETNHSLSGMNLQVEVGERFAKMVLDVLESYPSYTKILHIPLCLRCFTYLQGIWKTGHLVYDVRSKRFRKKVHI